MKTDTDQNKMEKNCRHIAPADSSATAQMRFHQSWYRHYKLEAEPGPNPYAHGQLYGNILSPDAARLGRNFLDDAQIIKVVEDRIAQGLRGASRLRSNMLSSQPMCFNLLAPLALEDHHLATRLISALPPLPSNLRVTDVLFEFAPDPDQHLRDGTAFDAFITYTRPGGVKGFIGIETKLTEPFSQKDYPLKKRYKRWLALPGKWWQTGAEKRFPDKTFNQLWRNHLLAFAMLHQQPPEYTEGYCAVIYHPEDAACGKALDAYQSLLTPKGQATLLDWPLDTLIAVWQQLVETAAQREWLYKFDQRYLNLAASEPAWEACQRE